MNADAQATETDIVAAEAKADEVTDVKEAEPEVKPSEPSPEKNSVQKRMNELTWKHRESERQVQELTVKLEAMQPPAPVETGTKTLEDFGYDEGMFQTYLTDKITAKAVEAARAVANEGQSKVNEQTRRVQFESKEKKYSEELDDYMDVTRSMPLTREMFEATTEMDDGPAVLYYLGKNQDVAGKIANLSPTAAAVELGRIAAKLTVEKATSKAPAPTPKIDGIEPGIEKDPDKMSMPEWLIWRRKHEDKLRK